jgi:endonuclease/exonuclease/phosphatase family metal-dependent hydrolase
MNRVHGSHAWWLRGWIVVAASCVMPHGATAQTPAGLGRDEGIPIIDWQQAGDYLDKTVIVQGKIVQTRNIGRMCFLNFDTSRSFPAIIRESSFENFSEPPEAMYDQKLVRIRGVITEFNGRPQIEVTRPEQITILEKEEPIPSQPVRGRTRTFTGTVTIATFNVLNLFDDYDDPYTEDETTKAKPKEELSRLAEAIRRLDADVLCLQEVENRGIVERFVHAMLADMGYREIVAFEGNDTRGIDCVVLSRFDVGPVTSYRHLRFQDDAGRESRFQRDFMRVRVEPPGAPAFDVFPVHFKSKRGGADTTESIRLGEMRAARSILDGLLKQDKDSLFVVCGDFNDTWDSAPLKAIRGEGPTALHTFFTELPKPVPTYNKSEYAEMIDFILVSPAMAKRYEKKSFKVIEGSVESLGSDHNPVAAAFRLK